MAYKLGAWPKAEETALAELVKRMNLAAGKPEYEIGRNVFAAESPEGRWNCWAMIFVGGPMEANWNSSISSLNFQGFITGLHTDRARAQACIEHIFTAHPIEAFGNIQMWRLDGNPTLKSVAWVMPDKREVRVWDWHMPVRLIIDATRTA